MKYWLAIITVFILFGCKTTTNLRSIEQIEKLAKKVKHYPEDVIGVIEQAQRSKHALNRDIVVVKALLKELGIIVGKQWGEDEKELPSQKKYVKYSNNYQARAIVDFDKGVVTVETIAKNHTLTKLKQAIITTLLTPADPRHNDIFSDEPPTLGKLPFLHQQVLDQDNKAIRYQWRANRFAEHLVKNQLVKRKTTKHIIHQVSFALVNDHQRFRQLQYSNYVIAAAKRYNVAPELIYAIIETESSFNPYAISTVNAYGLMQVVPSTAGKDVYQKVKQRQGQPSKATLFNPQHNIDIGTAYLYILNQHYLANINHHQSKEYAVISAYNGGAGNVLKTFDKDRSRAVSDINNLAPKSVYWALTNKHPRAESRKYLKKVTVNKKKY